MLGTVRHSRSDPRRFTGHERAIVDAHATPRRVQAYLRALPYNRERGGETLRTFRGVVRHATAHCLEAALSAATILEQHGHPPLLLDLESQDGLDHVVFLFRVRGRWGTVGRSRDVGLHGRRPEFRTVRDVVWSYVDPYVDGAGRIVGFGVAHLDEIVRADWRLGEGNVWDVERALIRMPHRRLRSSDRRYRDSLRRYLAARESTGPLTPKTAAALYGAASRRWL
jgi:hypothetical protein